MPVTRTQKGFPCPKAGCSVTLSRRWDVSRHLETHDPETKHRNPCPAKCGATFRQASNIRDHLKTCKAAAKARENGVSFPQDKVPKAVVKKNDAVESFLFIRYSGPEDAAVKKISSGSLSRTTSSSSSVSPAPSSPCASEESTESLSSTDSPFSSPPSTTCDTADSPASSSTGSSEESTDSLGSTDLFISLSPPETRATADDTPSQPTPDFSLTHEEEQQCDPKSACVNSNNFINLAALPGLQSGCGLPGGDCNDLPDPVIAHDMTPVSSSFVKVKETCPDVSEPEAIPS